MSNVMGPTLTSFVNVWNKDENNLDFGFIKNLLRYVLIECYPTINFKPKGIFAEDSKNHPLKLEVKSAVKLCLELNMEDIRQDFELVFSHGIDYDDYLDELLYLKSDFEKSVFTKESFLQILCWFSEYAALAYWSCIRHAPRMTIAVACVMLIELRKSGKMTENFWKEFEDFCESYVKDVVVKKKLKQPKRGWKKLCEIS